MSGSSSNLALLTGSKLSKVSVVVAFPINVVSPLSFCQTTGHHTHLVVEDLGLSRFGLWDESIVKDVENILADFLEFGLDLLAIVADGGDMFVRALGFLLLLNGRDDSPRGTSGSDDVLVGDREEVSLVNRELAT